MMMSDHENNRVLIVDDQKEIHEDFTEMLQPEPLEISGGELAASFLAEESPPPRRHFELLHARTGEDALAVVRSGKERDLPVALVYIDIRMPPGMDGLETIRRFRQVDRDVEIVIMTAYTDMTLTEIVHGMELLHKVLYIRKPFTREEIQQMTLSLVEKWNIERRLEEKRRQVAVEHRRLDAVINATGEPIAMCDLDGRLVFANRDYERLLELPHGELKAMSPEALAARVDDRFREPRPSEVEGRFTMMDRDDIVELKPGDGVLEQRLFYRIVMPVRDGAGETLGSLYVYRDVSKEMEMERMKAEVLRLRTELQSAYSFEGIVGDSDPMRNVYMLMTRAAESHITVLIRGESGTGKELVAKSFHFHSSRKARPFLAINCAAVPEALIESEMFGHERGAFTGAAGRRIGAFERASGGTIFLDEIGDMPLALQGKLLRVLQEREIQRVGSTATIAVDVRVISATNKDLEAAVEAREFREDLFYRIAAFPIVVPPLRQRREDIPLLARHFLEKHAERANRRIGGISNATMRVLLSYDWPGNVRELENAIERAVVLETADVLHAHNLPPHMSPGVPSRSGDPARVLPLMEVERQALSQALAVAGNNIAQAARSLGINRATLYRKMKKYDLLEVS